MSTTKSFYLHR